MYYDGFYSKIFSQQYFAYKRFILLYKYIGTNGKEPKCNYGIFIYGNVILKYYVEYTIIVIHQLIRTIDVYDTAIKYEKVVMTSDAATEYIKMLLQFQIINDIKNIYRDERLVKMLSFQNSLREILHNLQTKVNAPII